MRLVIFDATRKSSLLEEGWGIGSFSMWFRGRTDGMLGALSWKEAFDWLEQRVEDNNGPLKEIEFWGHGSSGEAYINGQKLTEYINTNPISYNIMCKDGLFWFRTCSTFHGDKGKEFAKTFSNLIGCTVAAHTHKIGFPFHSGLHSIKPNEEPNWSSEEGKDKEGNVKRSGMFKPNTIMFWKNTIPKGW